MKINSNTIKLEKESYARLEEVVKRIASENKIENVEGVQIELSKTDGLIKFAVVDDWAEYDEEGDQIRTVQEPEKDDTGYNGSFNWETDNVIVWVQNDESLYDAVNRYPGTYTAEQAEEFVRNILPDGTPDMDSSQDYEKVDWQEVADSFNDE